MKKINSILAICSAAFLVCSCQDEKGPAEKMGKQIDEVTQEAQKKINETSEKAQQKYDEIKQEAKKQYEDTKEKAQDTKRDVEEKINNKSEEIRKSIHEMTAPEATESALEQPTSEEPKLEAAG